MIKNRLYLEIPRYGQKNDFFRNDLKKRRFCRYVDIFGYIGKTHFKKWCQKNVLYLEMLIFADLLTKNEFFKKVYKNVVFVTMLICAPLWTKNDFLKVISKNVVFSKL